jgi:hypothetical protein
MFERAWKEREETVYTSLFNQLPSGIFSPQHPDDVAIGGSQLIASCAGVFEIPPTSQKPYWTYLSSGLSNPLEETPQAFSGYGIELMIQLENQSDWPIHLMFNLMGYIFETGNFFQSGHRMPCNGPMCADDPNCQLTTLLFWEPADLPATFTLESGEVELLDIQGITDAEYEFAQHQGSAALYDLLKKLPGFPTIDIHRLSIM